MNKMAGSNRKNDVPSVQLVHDRAWQRRGGSNGQTFKRPSLGQSGQQSEITRARLEAENAQLRGSLVDLMLQTQALRDALGHPRSEIRPKPVRLIYMRCR